MFPLKKINYIQFIKYIIFNQVTRSTKSCFYTTKLSVRGNLQIWKLFAKIGLASSFLNYGRITLFYVGIREQKLSCIFRA